MTIINKNIQVDNELWLKFKGMCYGNNTTPSKKISELISKEMKGGLKK